MTDDTLFTLRRHGSRLSYDRDDPIESATKAAFMSQYGSGGSPHSL